MPSTAWCNDCATCATDGCYDTCATTEVVMFIVFLFILFGVAVVTALVATVACCYASRLGMTGKDVLRRGMGLVTLLAAGVSLLVSLFFGWHEAPGSNAKPPCSTARHSIGLTYSGDTSNGDYFASCSSVKDTLETMSVLLYFTVAFTALSFLSTIALRTHWQAGASGVLALVFLIATLGLHGSRIVGDTDFCGSGRSLGELGYSPQSAYRSAWCAFVFIVLGGIVHPAVLHFKKIMPEGPVRHAIPEHYAPVATAVVVPAVPVGTTAAPMAAPPAATVQYGSTHYDV